ncbi:MAG TPA: hypothetical protein VEW42_03235 [Candidatus Eisenbacteria bacterium]|nr:hypothetical protein [Candidatus Eisenbacteria bacterium]
MTTAQDDQVQHPVQTNQGSDSGQVQRPAQDSARIAGGQPAAQPVQPQQPTQPGPKAHQPLAGVGGPKEAMGAPSPVSEWVSPSTPEVVLPQEVKDAGVEAHPVVEKISEDAQKSGVRMANSAMTVPSVQEETINLETSSTVLHQLKSMHKKVSDSFSWLVRLIIKEQDKKAHATD